MQSERKEEIGLVTHQLVSRMLLSALVFPVPEGWEAAEAIEQLGLCSYGQPWPGDRSSEDTRRTHLMQHRPPKRRLF